MNAKGSETIVSQFKNPVSSSNFAFEISLDDNYLTFSTKFSNDPKKQFIRLTYNPKNVYSMVLNMQKFESSFAQLQLIVEAY